MLAYIARRILLAAFTVWMMSLLTFIVMMLPEGDFVDEIIRSTQRSAGDYARTIETQLREYYGLVALHQAGVHVQRGLGMRRTALYEVHQSGVHLPQPLQSVVGGRDECSVRLPFGLLTCVVEYRNTVPTLSAPSRLHQTPNRLFPLLRTHISYNKTSYPASRRACAGAYHAAIISGARIYSTADTVLAGDVWTSPLWCSTTIGSPGS